jgi:hypothetical protein
MYNLNCYFWCFCCNDHRNMIYLYLYLGSC